MASFTLRLREFRTLGRLDWSPKGLCVLTGANGAGKTTTLDALVFSRALFTGGHESALRAVDGANFRRLGVDSATAVELTVEVSGLRWLLRFPMSATGLMGAYGEELYQAEHLVFRAPMYQDDWLLGQDRTPRDEQRCCARVLWDRGSAEWMRPLAEFLENIRVYGPYWLNQVKDGSAAQLGDSFLHGTGRNLWSVLSNCKASPLRYRGQFEWVLTEARKAFPELLGTIEFDRGLPYLFHPHATDPADGLPPSRAADGLLTGLLHLTALAGAKPGSVLAFDEMENQLHPHAIRSLLSAMRRQAEERDLTICVTTHSPVVLNQFRDDPEQVYVLGHGVEGVDVPAPMTELHTEEWLAQAKLGTLYERLAFSAPTIPNPAP
jgi:predicted ATPase